MGLLHSFYVLIKFIFLPLIVFGLCFYCCFVVNRKKRSGNIYGYIFHTVQPQQQPPPPMPLDAGGYIPPGAVPMMPLPPGVQPYLPPCPQPPPPPYDTYPNQMPPPPPGWYPPPPGPQPPPSAPCLPPYPGGPVPY